MKENMLVRTKSLKKSRSTSVLGAAGQAIGMDLVCLRRTPGLDFKWSVVVPPQHPDTKQPPGAPFSQAENTQDGYVCVRPAWEA